MLQYRKSDIANNGIFKGVKTMTRKDYYNKANRQKRRERKRKTKAFKTIMFSIIASLAICLLLSIDWASLILGY